MRIPALALTASLLLWGWQNQTVWIAAAVAVLLETARHVPWRWDLDDSDFNRAADLSAVGFLLLVVYQFDAHSVRGIYEVLRWLPMVLVLLVALQVYSTRDRISYASLFLSVRRAVKKGTVTNPGSVDIRIPYIVVCLVSAAAGTARGPWFYPAASAILAWLLWCNRPGRYRASVWVAVMAAGIGLGYLNQAGVVQVRRMVHPLIMEYFQDRIWSYRDPYRAYTAMGHIGRLKLSDRIVMRVEDVDGRGVPPLLREATYRTLTRTVWLSNARDFETVPTDAEGTTWTLAEPPAASARTTRISAYLPRGKGILSVPNGTFRIDHLPVEDLFRNRLGVLKVLKGPELVEYDAVQREAGAADPPPAPGDLALPHDVEDLVRGLADRLGLPGLPPGEAMRRVRDYFLANFTYSVTLRRPTRHGTPLQDFLLETREGHCEFFATATALLLRAAGIPARYAVGYAVQEYSDLEDRYIVRRRHAHSWALVHVDGRWQDFDTTPPVWGAMEEAQAPWWEGGYDLWSWLVYQYSRWRWGASDDEEGNPYLWLVVPLVLILAWRLYFRERVARARGSAGGAADVPRPGLDSEFYDLERHLAERGLARPPGEPLRHWLERLREDGDLADADALLGTLLPAHYRYRFDPSGIDDAERATLRAGVRRWLEARAAQSRAPASPEARDS